MKAQTGVSVGLRQLKSTLGRELRLAALTLALKRIRRSPQALRSDALFELLAWGWGNRAYIVEAEYLRGLVEQVRNSHGTILECGSGLSTLVAGFLIDGSAITLYALEHDAHWYDTICAMVRKFKLRNVRPVHAPLKDFGEFSWYEAREADLPRDISLVLCDGPPGDIRGGRYGLLPLMRAHLVPTAVILMDDYKRVEERTVIQRWIGEFGGSLAIVGVRFPYAVLTLSPHRPRG